jgi:hypothetical protein
MATAMLLSASVMGGAGSQADETIVAHDALLGVWAINFVVPPSPKGNVFGQPHRHPFTFRDDSGQRICTAKEIADIQVPGAWRASGDEFSATFEFTCPDGVVCGTITMRGSITSETTMRGRVIIIWDEADDSTPTGYDTVTGTFTGEKCTKAGVGAQHDTGGCESVQ